MRGLVPHLKDLETCLGKKPSLAPAKAYTASLHHQQELRPNPCLSVRKPRPHSLPCWERHRNIYVELHAKYYHVVMELWYIDHASRDTVEFRRSCHMAFLVVRIFMANRASGAQPGGDTALAHAQVPSFPWVVIPAAFTSWQARAALRGHRSGALRWLPGGCAFSGCDAQIMFSLKKRRNSRRKSSKLGASLPCWLRPSLFA